MKRIDKKDLQKYLDEAAVILRGHMGPAEYKQYIFPLLFWKRISDIWDEEHTEAIEKFGKDYSLLRLLSKILSKSASILNSFWFDIILKDKNLKDPKEEIYACKYQDKFC